MNNLVTCALCDDKADPENPFKEGAIREVNPETFRRAWMHGSCYEDSLETLKTMPSRNPIFKNRYDEYVNKIS
jgi:hypothetical protein